MTDRITEYQFDKECRDLAQEIFDDTMIHDKQEDETPEHHRDTMTDRAHETADGHQWVIYYHHAHNICADCNTDEGEAFLEDVGCSEPTYDKLATVIAYGEMRARIEQALDALIEEWEVPEQAA